jgi:predicted PurR-regulated permease PerM
MNISTEEVEKAMKSISSMIGNLSKGLTSGLSNAIGHIGSFLTNLLFAVIFAIYFLLDGKGLTRYWNRVLLAIGGKKVRREFHVLAKDADSVFSGYIRGQLIDALLMAVLVSASLSLIGVKYSVIIGVLSGIGNLIPYVGPVVAYGSTILVCLIAGDFRRLLVAIIVLFVIQTVDGNVINPRLLSSSIDVHPMLVIAALIIGGSVGGIVGMLFAVPVAAFLKIQFDKIIEALLKARSPEKHTGVNRNKTGASAGKKSART